MAGDSSLLRIGALARATGVPVRTIRFYSDQGILAPAGRSAGRYRLYGPDDRVRLEQVRILRELGFGLPAIARLFAGDEDRGGDGRGGGARGDGRGGDGRGGTGRAGAAVIEAQLRAVEDGRRHLARAAAVLRAALRGDDPARATLRVAAVLRLASWRREAALRQALAAPLAGTGVDATWLGELFDAAFADLPDELDDDQWAAFVELVALCTDPSFGAALARDAAPFWRRAGAFDAARWRRQLGELLARGARALAAGATPGSAPARRLADRYLAMVAAATGRAATPALTRWVVRRADAHDPRGARFWELVAAVHRRPPSPHARVMELVVATLRARLAAPGQRQGRGRGRAVAPRRRGHSRVSMPTSQRPRSRSLR